jgi:hypothetical protein
MKQKIENGVVVEYWVHKVPGDPKSKESRVGLWIDNVLSYSESGNGGLHFNVALVLYCGEQLEEVPFDRIRVVGRED